MKNFNDDFKRGSKKFSGPKSFHNESRPTGRFDKGRAPRSERDDNKPELFKTTCTSCGKPCEVPFRPDGVKPVLCRECFAAKNAAAGFNPAIRPNDRNQGTSSFRQDTPMRPAAQKDVYVPFQPSNDANYKELQQQIVALESKINRIVDLLSPVPKAQPVSLDIEPTVDTLVKTRKPKLNTPAVKKAAAKKKVAKMASLKKKAKAI